MPADGETSGDAATGTAVLPTPSLKTLVSIYAQQSEDGKVHWFTGSGSKEKVRKGWEKVVDDLVVSTTDYDALFDIVFTILRQPTGTELPAIESPAVDKRLKRVLYSFLKTVLAPPASLVLSQDNLPRTMDGIAALRAIRAKFEPLQKTHFRKELILDVIMFQLDGTTNPEPALLRWTKAIDHLKQAGCDSLDSLLRDILLNSLSPEYSTLISMWDEHEGGAAAIAQDDMIRSICTHFEHVVLPNTPAARKSASSAFQDYNERRNGSKPKNAEKKPPPKKSSKDRKWRERKTANAANPGLKDAQRKQLQHERNEKYKNTVCWVCGEKGHGPAFPGCKKHPDYKPGNKTGSDPKKSGKSTQLATHGIRINDDHFVTLESPRSDGADEE